MTRPKRENVERRDTLGASSTTVRRGRRVEVVPGVIAFRRIDFTIATEPYDLAGTFVLDDPPSRYLLDSITFRRARGLGDMTGLSADQRKVREAWLAEHAAPLTAEGIRNVAVERAVNTVLYHHGAETTFEELDEDQVAELRSAGLEDKTALRYVSAIYVASSLRGNAPAAWVAHHLNCSAATAARWIAAAKDAGCLQVANTRRR